MQKKKIYRNDKILLLIGILIISTFLITCVTLGLIYRSAIKSLETTLTDVVEHEKAIIQVLSKDSLTENMVLEKLLKIRELKSGIGKSGEFAIAKITKDSIEFVFTSEYEGHSFHVSINDQFAVPMQLALQGKSGFINSLDYGGKKVFAAYTYFPDFKWGIVAKNTVKEINAPYIKAGIIAFIIAILLILLCVFLFIKITNPIIDSILNSEKRFRALYYNSPLSYQALNSEGIIDDINPKWINTLGYEKNEVIGKCFSDFIHEKYRDWFKKTFENLKESGSVQNIEIELVRKDNTLLFISLEGQAAYDKNNNFLQSYSTFKDITSQKKIEKILEENQKKLLHQNEEYEAINEELKETNYSLHAAKEKVEKNETFLNKIGQIAKVGGWEIYIEANELFWTDEVYNIHDVDKTFIPTVEKAINFYTTDSIPIITTVVQAAIQKHEPFNVELKIITAKNKIKWVHSIGQPIVINGIAVKVRGIFQDITERKLYEEQLKENQIILKQQNEEYEALNEELTQLNEDLFEAKAKSEESDKLKSAFLQNMSHEVRTPMNAIVGFSELMTLPNQKPEKLKIFAQSVTKGCNKLLEIIADVIEISQIQANQINVIDKDFDIIPILTTISKTSIQKLSNKKVEFIFEINEEIQEYVINSDQNKIERILNHLLDNATKFTSNGFVKFKCNLLPGVIEFTIQDTGIGIQPEMQKIIFKPFSQVEVGVTRNFGGNGIGLAIVKNYVDLLEGKIVLESELNKGTTFTVTIPVENKDFVKKKENLSTNNLEGKIILIAEDELSIFEYVKEIFSETGATIISAENGQEALDICIENPKIDLVLMDIKMPVLDGSTATKLIRVFRPLLPIIAVTAYALSSDRKNFIESGFSDYIEKPISQQLLFEAIYKLLK